MPRIDGSAGPIPVSGSPTSIGKSVATVQLGESKLSEVAQRLGVDPRYPAQCESSDCGRQQAESRTGTQFA